MSDVHQNDKGLVEYIRGVWPQSMLQRRFLRALGVMSITTCVWMSGSSRVLLQTSRHSFQANQDRVPDPLRRNPLDQRIRVRI